MNIVVYYGPTILGAASINLDSALEYQTALGLINFVCTLIAIWKIDRWGRRPLLVWGMVAVAISMATSALLLVCGAPAGWVVLMLCLYMGCVAVSICGVIWVITPEIFPNRIRGRAMSIATFVTWGTNAMAIFIFPCFIQRYGVHVSFATCAAICLAGAIFFWRLVPETSGRSLEEIETYWLQKHRADQSRRMVASSEHSINSRTQIQKNA